MSGLPESIERLERVLAGIRKRHPEVPVQAIPWIRFKHPIHPAQTELASETGVPDWAVGVEWLFLPLRFLRCLLTALHMTLQLAFLQKRLKPALEHLKKKRFDLIAKTWAYTESLVPGPKDFYYGDLQQRLSSEGVRILLLTGKPSEMRWEDFSKASAFDSAPCQLPEMSLVPLDAPVQSVYEQLPVAIRLLGEAASAQDFFERKVLLRAAQDCMSPAVTSISLFYWIGREAANIWRPKGMVALYEGYGWEECLWRGAKERHPEIKTAGYQHTILLKHNLALLDPAQEDGARVRPELVLCLGPRTEQMLRPSHPHSDLFPFGTFRKMPDSEAGKEPGPEKKTLLVLPEGYPEEAVLLFNAALKAAQNLQDHRFILRSHPVLPIEKVLPHLELDPSGMPNVEISSGAPIEEDFARASAVLYRGSSSVLYGILNGLKPVYFSDGRFPDPDPLFELKEWKERVSLVDELEQLLRRYASTGDREAAAQWKPAAGYAASYVAPVQEDSIAQLISRFNIRRKEVLVA